jgi:hypothetical protein
VNCSEGTRVSFGRGLLGSADVTLAAFTFEAGGFANRLRPLYSIEIALWITRRKRVSCHY